MGVIMISKVKETIIKENLIEKGDNVLIALSGGPDSVFLFHILRILKDSLSFMLYATHINHMYRGEDANSDEKFVVDLCQQYDIKLFIKRKNATEYARELKLTEEEAGRKLRYDFFNDNLREIGSGKIAVAHNLNDQSETVLQRIIRGTGIDGLAAMSYKSQNIIRPILNIEKKDILNYLEQNGYSYCKDYTNELPIYGRNKVRLDLIPYIEKNYNPNIQDILFRMSQIMQRDSLIIDKYINILIEKVLKEKSEDKIIFDSELLLSLDSNEIGRIIRKAVKEIKGNTKNLENKHIEYAISFIKNNKTGKRIDLTDDIKINISYNNIFLTKYVEKNSDFEYNINIEDFYFNQSDFFHEKDNKKCFEDKYKTGIEIFIKEIGKVIILTVEEVQDYFQQNKKNFKKDNVFYVDYDKIKGIIKIRNRRNSDFMIPFGMNGKKKLKDIFIDNKVPLHDRDKQIILSDDEKIIFLENYRISNECKTDNNTKKILTILVEDKDEGLH